MTTGLNTRSPWVARSEIRSPARLMFVAPLLALVVIWAVVVPLFHVNPRVFPAVGAVCRRGSSRSATAR